MAKIQIVSFILLTMGSLFGGGFALEVDEGMTVDDLKNAIYKSQKIPIDHQHIVANGHALHDTTKKLIEYGIRNNTKIHIVVYQKPRDGKN